MRRMFQDYIKTGVKDFQAFTELAQTGELEPPTVELMRTARRRRSLRRLWRGGGEDETNTIEEEVTSKMTREEVVDIILKRLDEIQ